MAKYPAVVQIRNGSSRLPGKAMKPILGKPIAYYLIERIQAIPSIYRIIVATTANPTDDGLADYCCRNHVEVFRGDEDNVLDRIYNCVKNFKDKYFVKFWGDSPLIDPFICEDIIAQSEAKFWGYDYVSNNHPSTYPEGMQIEIIKVAALKRAYQADNLTELDREHVTPYIWRNPHLFKSGNVKHEPNIHDEYRFVIDYPEDFEQIRKIVEALYPRNPLFSMQDMMKFLDENPDVKSINLKRYESDEAYNKRVLGIQPNEYP